MKTILTALAAAPLMLALAAPAAAQSPGGRELAPDTEFTFDDDDVLGNTVAPDGTGVWGRTRSRRTSLVRPRLHFVPEMLKSVETL